MSGYPTDQGNPDDARRPFESMPAAQPYQPGPVQVGEPPQSVRRASTILYVSIALSLLGLILNFATRGALEDAIRDAATTEMTEEEISAAATLSLLIGAVVSIGFAVLYFICARKMLQARNWARIVPTVLIGLGILFGLVGLGAGVSGAGLVSQLISLALGIAFLVLAWNRASNAFFNSARTPR